MCRFAGRDLETLRSIESKDFELIEAILFLVRYGCSERFRKNLGNIFKVCKDLLMGILVLI
ncbi:MAG: hypothetical protein AUG51_19080 [Acidobacteria bacterium 13_1_20CM_3_53_8]|nr:MAG: hypothetical protein AUG51_19080 [Acidobacteria bacterium 13_1_20CM_3_53_8]